MISLDASAFFALVLAAVLAGVMIGVLPPWRRLMSGQDLPVRRFLRRRFLASAMDDGSLLEAELRCSLCAERASCNRRAGAGEKQPPESCPNGGLFTAA